MNITFTSQQKLRSNGSRWLLFFLFTLSAGIVWGQQKQTRKTVVGTYAGFKTRFSAQKDLRSRSAQGISLPVGDNESVNADLHLHHTKGSSEVYSGTIKGEKGSSFFIQFSNGKAEGKAILHGSRKAYHYTSDAQGNVIVEPVDIHKVLCVDYTAASSVQKSSTSSVAASSVSVPLLQSLPSAPGVIYLDFDGQYVVSDHWNGGQPINAAPSTATPEYIQQIWEQVVEDYKPFNVNITTDSTVFHSKPLGRRMRVIITGTSQWYPDVVGGVAYVGSFSDTQSDVPCWVFENNLYGIKNTAEATSHEAGHTVGLNHDGRDVPGSSHEEYYSGQGVWAPIMGSSYGRDVSQWSIGEYQYANNLQDDIAVIAGTANGLGLRADDHANANTGATAIVVGSNGHILPGSNKGFIGTRTDVDVFSINVPGGYVHLDILPNAIYPNLNIKADLYNQSNTLVATSDPAGNLSASFTFNNLAAGTYYLKIDGVGEGNPFTDGYSDYNSQGSFFISGVLTTPVCSLQAWSSTKAYNTGEQVIYNGNTYTAKWYTKGENPSTSSSWQLVGPCSNNAKPVATITAPANESWINAGNALTLNATATDNGSISRVEIYLNDTLVATQYDAPFTYTRNNAPAGKHHFSVIAYDNNNAASVPVFVVVNVNALPVGQITAPSFGTYYAGGSSVTVNLAASDPDGNISKVEFYIGGQQSSTKIGEVTSAPYTINAVVPSSGTYAVLFAVITDNRGAQTSVSTNINISSAQGPVVTISSPANNATFAVGSTINVTAGVSSPSNTQIQYVEFFQNNSTAALKFAAPYTYTITNAVSGTYSYKIIATDASGRKGQPAYVTFKVGTTNQLPVVAITSPADRSKYKTGGTATINATASDPDGLITSVEIYSPHIANSSIVLTAPPYTVTFTNLPSSGIRGTTSFVVKATDNAGTISSTSIDLVENKAPTVSITSPANNSTVNAGTSVTITASPADQDGTVNRVEFYDNSNLLVASTTAAPYQYVVSNTTAGTYTYKAIAYDDMNVASTTATVTFTVTSQCTVVAWNSTTAYSTGQRVSYSGTVYEAKWWTQGANPASNSGTNDVWKVIGPCTAKLASSFETEDAFAASGSLLISPVPVENIAKIAVTLPASGFTQVSVYNMTGTEVATLASDNLSAGDHDFVFNASDLASGLYIVRISAPGYNKAVTISKK